MQVAVLGATGLVGQKFIALFCQQLQGCIVSVSASDDKSGLLYHEGCQWQESLPMPEEVAGISLQRIQDIEADYVVSFLPSSVAFAYETQLLAKGKVVFSNTSAYRMHPDVPILIPEVNRHHLSLLERQTFRGRIITNSNCCVSGLALVLDPLLTWGIEHVHVVTLQSASGAGYPGVPSLDLLGNTIPHIPNEERKICQETRKILNQTSDELHMSVSVHRVPVVFGHTLSLHITFSKPVCPEEVIWAFKQKNQQFPDTYVLYDSPCYPQARKCLTNEDMRVHVGPITQAGDMCTVKMNILVHNLVRGAAGAVLANIQAFIEEGYVCEQPLSL